MLQTFKLVNLYILSYDSKISHIQSLNLEDYSLATDGLLEAIGLLFWSSLRELKLKGCSLLTDNGFRALGGCRYLTELNISGLMSLF